MIDHINVVDSNLEFKENNKSDNTNTIHNVIHSDIKLQDIVEENNHITMYYETYVNEEIQINYIKDRENESMPHKINDNVNDSVSSSMNNNTHNSLDDNNISNEDKIKKTIESNNNIVEEKHRKSEKNEKDDTSLDHMSDRSKCSYILPSDKCMDKFLSLTFFISTTSANVTIFILFFFISFSNTLITDSSNFLNILFPLANI